MNVNKIDCLLDGSTDAVFALYEELVLEAELFGFRHSNSDIFDPRLLSDLTCLVLRFGRSSDIAAALTEQRCGVLNSETTFWLVSHITANLDLINETCREVDRLTRLAEAGLRLSLGYEATCWAEDFSMEQPDNVRIELKFGMPPTTAVA